MSNDKTKTNAVDSLLEYNTKKLEEMELWAKYHSQEYIKAPNMDFREKAEKMAKAEVKELKKIIEFLEKEKCNSQTAPTTPGSCKI